MPKALLTPQQKYLLDRLPRLSQFGISEGYGSRYDTAPGTFEFEKDADTIRAEKTIEKLQATIKELEKEIEVWKKARDRAYCQFKRTKKREIEKAREAIYFQSPETALALIRRLEEQIKGCPAS